MSEQKTYRVIRGSIRLPRGTEGTGFVMTRKDMIMQGELVPPGIFPTTDIKSWLAEGRIEPAGVSVETAEELVQLHQSNPFRVDPSALVGKTMEDLIILVLEIDEDYDVDLLADEAAAVQLLTSGWTPEMQQTITPANDRSKPASLDTENLSGSDISTGNRDMSAEAAAGLAAARAKAQAPSSEE